MQITVALLGHLSNVLVNLSLQSGAVAGNRSITVFDPQSLLLTYGMVQSLNHLGILLQYNRSKMTKSFYPAHVL